MIKYLLQQYEDGTFGYLNIDGDEYQNYRTSAKVICTQGKDEDRDEFITKNKITFQKNQYGSNLDLDIQINEEKDFCYDIQKIIKQNYGLDKLMFSDDPWIRCEVAGRGYRLDTFINDEVWQIRANVAGQGYGLDILINDKDKHVRAKIAELGYKLNVLINDEDAFVREAVAEQGYGFETLINDSDSNVRNRIAHYLNEKATEYFIIDLGNKLLDKGYKLTCNDVSRILYKDGNKIKFKPFDEKIIKDQILARLLYINIRVDEIYDSKYSTVADIILKRRGN